MLLLSKNALVFAASGAIGGEVARQFAKEGAQVWLSGRNAVALSSLQKQIEATGGTAHVELVDATDASAVIAYVKRVTQMAGSIDVVFNGIGGRPSDLGYPSSSLGLDVEQFFKPLRLIVGSTFLTSQAVAQQMIQQGSGAIVTLSATLTGMTAPHMASITATCGAIEAMTRSLAGEFGRSGVRVNCVRGSAMPETRTIQETMAGQQQLMGSLPTMELPPLGRPISVGETAATVAFLASDRASGMTGQVVTVCAGAFVG
ncbi:MAG: SDR family oxidoreductase [Cyanobacteriota bacterium]|nr:SDR family oxidoreductase [Cyanobacteriota bacterium]